MNNYSQLFTPLPQNVDPVTSNNHATKDSTLIFDSYFWMEVTIILKFEMLDGKQETLYSRNKNSYKKTKSAHSKIDK